MQIKHRKQLMERVQEILRSAKPMTPEQQQEQEAQAGERLLESMRQDLRDLTSGRPITDGQSELDLPLNAHHREQSRLCLKSVLENLPKSYAEAIEIQLHRRDGAPPDEPQQPDASSATENQTHE